MTQDPSPRRDASPEAVANVLIGYGKLKGQRLTEEQALQFAKEILAELKEAGEEGLPQLIDRYELRYTVVPENTGDDTLDISYWGGTMWHTVETMWFR